MTKAPMGSDFNDMPEQEWEKVIERIGPTHFRQRFSLQAEHASEFFWRARTLIHIENANWLMTVLRLLLKATGLYSVGYRNFRNVQIVHNDVWLSGLPRSFEGFRILHLSDLHLDLDETLTPLIAEKAKPLQYDICVITGDYRNATSGPYQRALQQTARLVGALEQPVYGILGNHDFIEFVPGLEATGLQVLLNESIPIKQGTETVFLSGVDDAHFYETHNFQKALSSVPQDAFSILLSHTPESYRVAAACGYDLMFSGHTHGGQICLPGGFPVITNANCPRRMVRGNWSYRNLVGYTSPGTGSGGVPARFFCPPEITLHKLHQESANMGASA
jgi:predicted MPP superfamily phosphohydrolase